ncbi:hypothetical protein GEV33_003708 [Tenebrio molitor]|uniref:Uncharacterized protein n=1 Tax=Tenebrio molitor TaxID=7067 RepID=A0A8J6LH72_TENMO|nr:hypothetical protein GEV33_003708 [Tenebrio molitor]
MIRDDSWWPSFNIKNKMYCVAATAQTMNGLSDPDFRYRPRQFGERRGEIYKGGTDAMLEVLDEFRSEVKTDPWCATGAGEPVEEDRIGWKIILEESQPKRRGG